METAMHVTAWHGCMLWVYADGAQIRDAAHLLLLEKEKPAQQGNADKFLIDTLGIVAPVTAESKAIENCPYIQNTTVLQR
jgi:hypothetical protein